MKRIFYRGMSAPLSMAWLAIGASLTWAQVPMKTVALSAKPAPGTESTFTGFGRSVTSVLGSKGEAAFIGFLTGPAGWSLWRGSSNADLTPVSRAWDVAPGTGGRVFLNYGLFDVNDQGQLAFTAELTDFGSTTSTGDFGIWAGESREALTFVMRKGDVAPGTGGKKFGNPQGLPSLNNAGHAAFRAALLNPDNTSAGTGLWTGSSNADLTLIAHRGDPGPTGGVFSGFSHPEFNNSGEIAFDAHMTTHLAIWFWKAGVFTQVARTGVTDPAQGGPGGGAKFAGFLGELGKGPNLNGKGEVAFLGVLSNLNQGIWIWRKDPVTGVGALTAVAQSGEAAPGTALTFAVYPNCSNSDPCFKTPVLNNQGAVAFPARLSDGSFGIWVWNGSTLTLVARTGDQLTVAPGDSRTIQDLHVQMTSGSEEDGRRSSFNDAAEATFVAMFTDNSQGVFIAKVFEHPPVANAGLDQTVNEGDLVTLDGSGSRDADRDLLTYHWRQIGGPSVSLNLSDPIHPTFIACCVPAGGATLTFELTVSDGRTSTTDIVNISVKNVNHAPVADAGVDQFVQEGSTVMLDGSSSYDPDGELLSFSWAQTGGPTVTLSDATSEQPTFLAPLVGSTGEPLTFEVTVSDGIASATDTVVVRVENVNHAPLAEAGDNQTASEGSGVTLDATQSQDPDGDALTYSWEQLSGPSVEVSDPSSATPTFTAPLVSLGGATLVFRLIVNDGALSSDPDTVTITIQDLNDPPACDLAQANPALLWPPNHKLVPVGIVGITDPNNDAVTLTITAVTQDEPVQGLGDGDTSPDAVPQGSEVLVRTERAGQGNGRVYRVYFTAADGQSGSCTGSVTVCVPQNSKVLCTDDGQLYDSLQP